jgi:hypothetical protein
MIPKEKAEQLYNKYLILIADDVIDMKIVYGTLTHKLAKQSALIALNEILEIIDKDEIDVWNRNILIYWKEVKQEILSL